MHSQWSADSSVKACSLNQNNGIYLIGGHNVFIKQKGVGLANMQNSSFVY